jgi:predicted RecA/RadA family phage recombinase
MKNYVQPGHALDLTAPAAVTSGDPVKIGSLIVIPAADAASGETFVGYCEGVYDVDKAAGSAWTEGLTLYWDDTNKVFTTVSTSNTKCGSAAAAAASGDTAGRIRLQPSL